MEGRTTRCIECGGLVDSLNEDEQGAPCPACADRLLETLPGVFHRPWMESWSPRDEGAAEESFAEEAEDVEPEGGVADESPAWGRHDDEEPDQPA